MRSLLSGGIFAISTALLPATLVAQAKPSDAEIDQVLETWSEIRKRRLDGIPDPAAARALGDLAIDRLDAMQLDRLCAVMLPQTAELELRARFGRHAEELAKSATPAGALAAVRLSEFLVRPGRGAPADETRAWRDEQSALMVAASKHAGLPELLQSGQGCSFLTQLFFHRDPEALAEAGVLDRVIGLPRAGNWPVEQVRALQLFFRTVSDEHSGLMKERVQAFRQVAVEVTARALIDESLDAREVDWQKKAMRQLLGASARGELIDHEAPRIDVLWCNREHGPESFADLKGKIVLVDFWATWCGPCVAGFPKLRELTERSRGLPVEFVGITSPQGYVVDPKATDRSKRRTTTEKLEDELAAMGHWCERMDVTWTVLVTKQSCFSPDFQVEGIPHLALIGPDGKVLENGGHSAGPELIQKIDALLRAMGETPPSGESR